MTKRNAIW